MNVPTHSSTSAFRCPRLSVFASIWKEIRSIGSASKALRNRTAMAKCGAALALLLGAALPVSAQTTATKFIPTFLVYYGGGPVFTTADMPKLAKFDMIDTDRFRYDNIGSNTWAAIKALNPNTQVYVYEMGAESPNYLDTSLQVYLNGLGRHNVSRGHPQGSLNGNNPGLFQLDAAGNRIYNAGFSNVAANQLWYLMDFGSAAYQSYWVTSAKADIADQPWRADGVFVDNCLALASGGSYNATSQWYSTNASWSAAMNSFASAITAGMHVQGQKLWCNRGETRTVDGAAAWQSLDNSATPPDVLLEEGVFAVQWGPGDVWFHDETEWKRQLDTMAAIKHSKVAMMSHTDLAEGQSGTDNLGKPVTYWQTLWYAVGSFLLGKNDTLNNSYFMFNGGSGYNKIWWYDEYDKIDLGKALGAYKVTSIGGVNIYSREFEKGYVYVNATGSDVASIALPQASRLLSHANLLSVVSSITAVNAIPLKSHNSAILLKTTATVATPTVPVPPVTSTVPVPPVTPTGDTTAPSVPTGLKAIAASQTQINLTWTASTDNVGVKGYYVYVNDVALSTTTGTSFQHTGLTAGTTYNYRVSAFDAVPNHSAWTATPVSAKTLATDTIKPSVPTLLKATAVSQSQINLSWAASTDNVGVKGYYVYVNDVPLTTTTSTSFQHTGLTAGTIYKYRVSAYDAVPNNSAWTATPVSAKTLADPTIDATAPTVPTLLKATVVSQSQINLSWTASTDKFGVTGYYVYVNGIALTTTTGTSFQHTGLTAGTTYRYRVSAFDAVPNNSAWTAIPVLATTRAADTTKPSVPTLLKATVVSQSQINLSWAASTDNVGVKGYYVYVNDVPLTTTTGTSFQHTGLTAGTTYNYRVSAFDAVPNNSAWTATPVSAKTLAGDTTAPSVPAGLSATAVSPTQVNLTWTASTDNVGVKGYYVYLNDVALTTTTDTSIQLTGLTAGTTYNYRVSAFDAVPNHSAWTAAPVSVTTPLQ
jgi:chitodextrinase